MPTELHAEILAALRFDVRWVIVRVSFVFDHFLRKKQFKWIRNELKRRKILEINRRSLGQAKRRLLDLSRQIFPIRLISLRNLLASFFDVENSIGLTQQQFDAPLTPGLFETQLLAMVNTVDRNDITAIRRAKRFLQNAETSYLGYVAEFEQI
ncbi:hypothetical protein niasHS_008850 [Heterodera schachtii]|uniref:F-box domain-containing protein n=1 Tax=Heterodera schachtii TaxID=97005 RepID=A0ABD2J4U7_HETSC